MWIVSLHAIVRRVVSLRISHELYVFLYDCNGYYHSFVSARDE